MRSLQDFDFERARDAAHAIALARGSEGTRYVAGGTDLVPNLRHGLAPVRRLVDISGLEALQGIVATADGGLAIGAGVTLATIAASELVATRLPALAEAARSVAAPQHRSAATLGGNLCQDTRCAYYNQGEWWREANGFCLKYRGDVCHVAPQGKRCRAAFCSDLAAVLLAADARVQVIGSDGERTMPLQDLYRDDGAAHLALAPGDLLARVAVPPTAGPLLFEKLRQRGGIDFPLASVAVAALPGRVRIALSGTNSQPVAFELDAASTDAAVRSAVLRQADCMRTTTTAAHYRREATAAIAVRLVARVTQRKGAA